MNINNILETLLFGRKGGLTAVKIIDALLEMPLNANELSKKIQKDYNTIRYQTKVLVDANIIEKDDRKYSSLYKPSTYLIENLNIYRHIRKKVLKKYGLDNEYRKNISTTQTELRE